MATTNKISMADEYEERVKLAKSRIALIHVAFPNWKFLNCHMAIVLAMPMHELRAISSTGLYNTCRTIPPLMKLCDNSYPLNPQQ